MKILVTGASGFVGTHLLRQLKQDGHVVTGISHEASTDPQMIQLDLLDEASVHAFDLTDYEYVIHLAGLAAVGPSFKEPKRYITANAEMQINLFEACLKQGANPGFLIVSSGSLYDPSQLPITESSPLKLTSPYAVSKLGQESIARYYGQRGFKIIIARPFNHIGPGQLPGFIVADLAAQLQGKQSPVAVKVGNLASERDYTDVRDIARAYSLLIVKGKSGEIYNVCSGQSVSGQQILDELAGVYGVTVTTKNDPALARPTDIPKIYGSYDKLKNDTGWTPSITLHQTLADVRDALSN